MYAPPRDLQLPDSQDPNPSHWLVVSDYETGEQVDRRGPFATQEAAAEAKPSLRERWQGRRYVIRVRSE